LRWTTPFWRVTALLSRALPREPRSSRGDSRLVMPCAISVRLALSPAHMHAACTLPEANFFVWPAEGTYVINPGVLEALHGRHLDFELPHEPNFYDEIPQYELNRETFVPTPAVRHSRLFVNSHSSSVLTRVGWPACTAASHRRGVLFHGIREASWPRCRHSQLHHRSVHQLSDRYDCPLWVCRHCRRCSAPGLD
jgi:hypothetical protein